VSQSFADGCKGVTGHEDGGGSWHAPEVMGAAARVSLSDGRIARVIQLNNAATTPPFRRTLDAVNAFFERYGALHRGAGPHARRTCEAVDDARASIRRFIGCSPEHALLFTQNTSAAVSLLARILRLRPDDVVLTSALEHTSNNLPWRAGAARVVEVAVGDSGDIDYEHLADELARLEGHVKVVALTGASNQTGFVTDLARVARLTSHAGALLFVDAAQLAPHRPIDLARDGVDALAFSAHKVYAPFGLGVLALPRRLLAGAPVDPGGGSVDMLSEEGIVWSPPDERHQPGTWNAAGIIALGASCDTILAAGWHEVLRSERALVRYTAQKLAAIPGVRLHVAPSRYVEEDRIGTFPFSIDRLHHALAAAALEHEHGIEVRAGTICNHRLVRRWFGVDDEEQRAIEGAIERGDRLASYGIVRASLGIHSTTADIDELVAALEQLGTHGPRLSYRSVPERETFEPDPATFAR
jgi:cysteine desulfurase/selenocysteine lyase